MLKKRFLALILCALLVCGLFGACGDGTAETADCKVGDTVVLGSYEQDGDASNGAEPLEWTVLEVKEDRMLVIASKVVDGYMFHEKYGIYDGSLSWENCDLRTWLKETFTAEAFSEGEAERILLTEVETVVEEGSLLPKMVTDRLFLLSPAQVEKYFPTAEERKCEGTAARKASCGGSALADWWWMREFDDTQILSGRLVNEKGEIAKSVVNYAVGIRPAMWIRAE